MVSTLDVDLDVGTSLARADSHFLAAHQKVDFLGDHHVSTNEHVSVETINVVTFASQDSFDELACLEVYAWDPDRRDHVL